MSAKFNLDRPKLSDAEIERQKDFAGLVKRFKEQSIRKARGDESWRGRKLITYSAVILGVTVICTVTLLSLRSRQNQGNTTNDKITTTKQSKGNSASTARRSAFVNPPNRRLDPPVQKFTVDAARGAKLHHRNGTSIDVPASCFTKRDGKTVIGSVTIEYREFHTPAEIIVSGIPMAYDSAGHKFNLETAGMFEIRGVQDGEPVSIRADKSIRVELASRVAENRFNQYYLDTAARNWNYLRRDDPKNPPAFAAKAPPLPVKEQTAERESELKKMKIAVTEKIAALPAPAAPYKPAKPSAGRPNFKLDGSYDEFPDLAPFRNVLFEVGPENTNYTPELQQITWSDVKMNEGPIKGKNYLLTLRYRRRTEKLLVYPVFEGSDFNQAMHVYDRKLQEYREALRKREDEEKRLIAEMQAKEKEFLDAQKKQSEEQLRARIRAQQSEAEKLNNEFSILNSQTKAVRLFAVARFGIYNSDCPKDPPAGKSFFPLFTSHGKSIYPESIYLVDHSGKSVYQIAPGAGLSFEPGRSYSLCLFRKDRIFVCNRESLRITTEGGEKKIECEELPEDKNNISDFSKALEI